MNPDHDRLTAERSTPRREFIGQLAASAVVLAGTGCTTSASSPSAVPTPAPQQGAAPGAVVWDDSWFAKLTAKHKAVFDSPEIEDGLVLANATGYIRGMRDVLSAGVNDVQTVVVIRHTAIPMIFNDAMWVKYEIGAERKVKDGPGDTWATRNLWSGASGTGRGGGRGGDSAQPGAADRPQANFAWLATHGHFILGCDLATRNVAGILARKAKADRNAVYEELKANLLPGVILQPTGVYACHRAQEAGCTYIRST